jgi:hypothetical protein
VALSKQLIELEMQEQCSRSNCLGMERNRVGLRVYLVLVLPKESVRYVVICDLCHWNGGVDLPLPRYWWSSVRLFGLHKGMNAPNRSVLIGR